MFLNNLLKKSLAFFSKVVFRFRLICSNFHLGFVRTLAEGRWSHVIVPFVVVIFLAGIVLWIAYGGMCLVGKTDGYGVKPYEPTNVFDAAYYLLFTNGGQNLYDGAHWLGIIITSVGIVFIAVLTSMITNAFERIGQRYLAGESSFLMNNHIVIIGTSDVIYSILKSKRDGKSRFLIMTSRDVASKRRELLSILDDVSYNKRLCFLYGDRTSNKDIKRLSLAYAKEVFVIGDSEESDSVESYRDSNNMDCVDIIAKDPMVIKLRNGRNKLPCHVMFEYQTTFAAFQFSEMGDTYKDFIDFMPFNFYDMWAQKVFVDGGTIESESVPKYKFMDTLPHGGYISKDSKESVHLIIIGITKMGIAMGLQAAHICHYPNFLYDHSRRTRITFIDADADIEFNYLNGRYKSLFQNARHRVVNLTSGKTGLKKPWSNENSWLDVEWEFIKGRVESPNVQSFIKTASEDTSRVVTLAICLTRSHQSIATAMYLPDSVFQNCLQVLVYQRLSGTIIDKISTPINKKEQYRYESIRSFGMIDGGYDPLFEDNLINRAKYISYVYDSYYRTTKDGQEIDEKDRVWDDKLESYYSPFYFWGLYANYEEYWAKNKKVWEKLSCQFNAELLNTRLRSIGIILQRNSKCTLDCIETRIQKEIDNLQQVEHNRWNIEKLLTGYRPLTSEEFAPLKKYWDTWHDQTQPVEARQKAKEEWRNLRKQLKEWPTRAHLDICSFDDLKTREEEAVLTHDKKLNTSIPHILVKEGKIG